MWTYLPASVCSADTADSILPSDSPASNPAPSATSSGTSTVSKSCASVKSMDSWMTRRSSGETSENSMDSPGVEEWISSLPAHPANLIVKPENCAEPATIETSSPIRSESLAKYSREESIWRTCQVLMFDQRMDGQPMGEPWSESWPRQGMTVDGTLYQRKTLAHRISESDGGSWPTPQAMDSVTRSKESFHRIMDRPRQGAMLPKLADIIHVAPMWNTPNTMDSLTFKSQHALNHEHDTARPGRTNPNNLRDQVAVQEGLRLWPTPTGDDANNATRTSGAFQSLTRASGSSPTGQLSATWICWLMGIPLGWDSLEPLPEGAYAEWAEHMSQGTWWAEERGLPRLAEGQKDRVNRLKMLGNGVVPASGALAFITLEGE